MSRFLLLVAFFLAAAFAPDRASAAGPTSGYGQAIAEARDAMQVEPRRAIAAARRADRFADRTADPEKRAVMHATVQWLVGEAYLRIDEGGVAVPIIEQAFATIDRRHAGTTLHGDLLLSMGGIAVEKGDVAAAQSYYQRAYRVFHKLGQTRSQARALIQIAILFYDANDWASSLKYLGQALETYDADPGLSSSIHNSRGLAFKEMGRLDEAKAEYDEALKLARGMNSALLVATVLDNAARLDLARGDVQRADREIAESMRVTGANTPPEFHKQQYALAAQAAYQHRDFRRAATLIEAIFAGVDLARTTLDEREAHRTAIQTYEALGRDDLSLVHLRALKRLDDDATALARSTGAALMSARFDYANQSLRIANLQAQDARKTAAYERARSAAQRIIFYGASGATAIAIALLLYALRTSRRARVKVQAANHDLAHTNVALEKALAARTEFLATTSHEIRTPLNGILGMTQVMLADAALPDPIRDRVGVVHEAGITMRALVDDILDVAKMETGNLMIENAPFDLAASALDIARLWRAQTEAKGLRFEVALDDCPELICGDAARMRQMLFNLLSNALKFTAEGRIAFTIAARGDRLLATVADSGIGIPADKQATIFESFQQADTSTTRRFGGTGLGLAISRNLARAMGGDIIVRSRPGEGATFVVDLPLILAEPAAAEPCCRREPIDLLIVDRNPITRNMLKALFADRFDRIGFAASLPAAIECSAQGEVGVVLIDDATARLGDWIADLRTLAERREAPVALLWPVGAAAERDELLATGIDLVIAKPVTGAALVERLMEIVDRRYGTALESRAA